MVETEFIGSEKPTPTTYGSLPAPAIDPAEAVNAEEVLMT